MRARVCLLAMMFGRSVSRFFSNSFLPALCTALAVYFGYHAVWGEGGYYAGQTAQKNLAQQEVRLARMSVERQQLERRIALLQANDRDMIEELARKELMNGAQGQVAVPREKSAAN